MAYSMLLGGMCDTFIRQVPFDRHGMWRIVYAVTELFAKGNGNVKDCFYD